LPEKITLWPELPEHIEAAVTALIRTYNPEKSHAVPDTPKIIKDQ